jgi:hypothetical protein
MALQGYPRRHAPQRRAAPTVTLFDPSGDAACTGWWRTDTGVTVSSATRGLATGMTSRLADQKPLVNAACPPWIIVPAASSGFPALLPMNEGWTANGIAVNGDRSITATWIFRFMVYRLNSNQLFAGVANMGYLGAWDNWLRLYHPYLGWWNVIDNLWFPWNSANITVLTMRVKPVDEAGGNLLGQYRLNWNTAFLGPFNQASTSYGDRVMSETHGISANGIASGNTLFHEMMFFRRHLSDAEVIAMHNLLLLQYGQA